MKLEQEIKSTQEELDRRTEVENQAIELIASGKYEDAIELLKTI